VVDLPHLDCLRVKSSQTIGPIQLPRLPQHSLGYRLAHGAYAFHTRLERDLRETLVELDLTLPLADVIWHMDPARGPMSRRELAERLCCDPSNVTFLVNRLAKRDLISRARDARDRRVTALALTPSGTRARERLIATVAGSPIFTGLTRGEQGELAELLARCTG